MHPFSMNVSRAAAMMLAAAFVLACSGDGLDPDRPAVATVVVSPDVLTLGVSSTAPLQAEVRDADGDRLTDRRLFWASSDESIASVNDAGVVTGIAPGQVQIAASAEGKSAIADVTITPQAVASVRITPTDRQLDVGQSALLVAEPLAANGSLLTGRSIKWTSSNVSVASVSSVGLVTAIGAGGATITATSEGRSAAASITVSSVPVASVAVSPTAATISVGQTTQLGATTRDASSRTLSGRLVGWTSASAAVATVSSSGLVTAVAPGTATITASSEGKSGSATITVQPKPVGAVIVSPNQAGVTVGQSIQLSTQVTDGSGNVLTGRPISFSSSDPALATVSNSGLVSGVAAGTVTITATSEGKSGTATVLVSDIPVATVTVAPDPSDLVVGATAQLVATTTSATGATLSGRAVAWTSGAPGIASVSSTGLVTALGPGSAVIFATSEGKVGTATVNVRRIPVASVVVTPDAVTLPSGSAAQISVEVRDANGTVVTDRAVGWSSTDEAVAVVSSTGRVVALTVGQALIIATSEGIADTTTVTVTPVPVASVTVTPANPTLSLLQQVQLSATTFDGGGNVLTGRGVSWTTSDPLVATVSTTGEVTALLPGTATITATSEGVSGTAIVTVQ